MLYGSGVSECHCYVVFDGDTVTLYPLALLTSVGGLKVSSPTVLQNGEFQPLCMLHTSIHSVVLVG